MDNKIFKVYKGALLAKKFADESLAIAGKKDDISDLIAIKSSAEQLIFSSTEVFRKTFSEDVTNYPRIDIQDFFNNLNSYSEILDIQYSNLPIYVPIHEYPANTISDLSRFHPYYVYS